jgi:Zn ribbon nucleic-acid-binding protein
MADRVKVERTCPRCHVRAYHLGNDGGIPHRMSCVNCGHEAIVREALEKRDQFLSLQNDAMPQSSKEKQEAFRARNAMLGLTEVRGIFAPPELHAAIKEAARKLVAAELARRHPHKGKT